MKTTLDDVLKRVAAGELTPEEALRLIEPEARTTSDRAAADSGTAEQGDVLHEPGSAAPMSGAPFGRGTDEHPGGQQAPAWEERPGTGTVRSVRLLLAYRAATVVADPTVTQVHVRGQHSVRQEGDVLMVDGGRNFDPRRGDDRGGWFSFAALPRSLSWVALSDDPIVIRINPDLPVDIDATGASLQISGLEAGARMRLLAAAVKVERLRGPIDLDVRTSSVKGTIGPSGRSRITCEQSSVKIALLPGANLQMTAENRMSKVALPGVISKSGNPMGDTLRAQLGDGTDTLTIEALMSSVVVSTDAGSR